MHSPAAARGFFGIAAFALFAFVACAPPAFEAPKLPQPQLTLPEVPAVEPPAVAPPSVDAPSLPDGVAFPEGGGNCCLRDGSIVKSKCQGSSRCCVGDMEEDACEVNGGFWYFTPQGCAGGC